MGKYLTLVNNKSYSNRATAERSVQTGHMPNIFLLSPNYLCQIVLYNTTDNFSWSTVSLDPTHMAVFYTCGIVSARLNGGIKKQHT